MVITPVLLTLPSLLGITFRGYTFRLKTLGLDGAIILLESKPFNEFKSEIKFVEFTALGVPSLVKNMLPYSEMVKSRIGYMII